MDSEGEHLPAMAERGGLLHLATRACMVFPRKAKGWKFGKWDGSVRAFSMGFNGEVPGGRSFERSIADEPFEPHPLSLHPS